MKLYVCAFLVTVLGMGFGAICGNAIKEGYFQDQEIIFKTVEYSGHTYIVHINSENFIHDPYCKCMKGDK